MRRVLAVHGAQHAVRPRLHRQVQEGHQPVACAMQRNEIVAHVIGVAGQVADAGEAVDARQPLDQRRQGRGAACLAGAMIGVDVLAEQRHFAHACGDQRLHLSGDPRHRPRALRAARKRHDAKCAKLVAAFLHGDESGDAALARLGARRGRKMIKLVFGRKFRVDDAGPRPRLRHQLRQAVIVLRPDHQIDGFLPPQDFRPFGLRHAAGDGDHRVLPGGGAGRFMSRTLPSSENTFSEARSRMWQVLRMTRSASSTDLVSS